MTNAHYPQTFLARALADGHAVIAGEGRSERIHYLAADHSERWADPEEKVRAELWAELIYRYEYAPELIAFEVNVPRRTPDDFADLVIYSDDEKKMPYFVIECKRADLSDAAFNQAIEQACGNRASLGALYCGAVAGLTRRLLRFDDRKKYPPGERERNHLTDIPVRYGNPPEWRFYKNENGKDLAAVPGRSCGRPSASAIKPCGRVAGAVPSPPLASSPSWCSSSTGTRKTWTTQRRTLRLPAAGRRNRRPAGGARQCALRPGTAAGAGRVHRPNRRRAAHPGAVRGAPGGHIPGPHRAGHQGRGLRGVHGQLLQGRLRPVFHAARTDRFLRSSTRPERTDLVLDPACGSGGFLLYALDHVRREADRRFGSDSIQHFQYWHNFAQDNLYGLEINEELARVTKMNMIIHDDGHTNIIGHDAMDFPENIRDKNPGLTAGRFDLILTNPPFGATIRRAEKGDGYLEQFELQRYLGKNYPNPKAKRASIKTKIAFLERIHSFLKPGSGRAAVVLPDGILTNSSLQGVRHWLLHRFQLLAVVSLPQFAFSHYDAGVKASIVFLRRLADGETVPDDTAIFMALAENIGYDATGHKTFTVEPEEEIPDVRKVERHRCDLFDYRVTYEWVRGGGAGEWSERRREVIPGTGLVGQWEEFNKDPTPFFA